MAEHLKLVQDVVARMAANGARMKTWTVALVAATFVFSGLSDEAHWIVSLAGCIPVVFFWSMDAKYLHLERCYIKLYEAVAGGEPVKLFDLDYRPHAASVASVWSVAASWSLLRLYGPLLFLMLALSAFFAIGAE